MSLGIIQKLIISPLSFNNKLIRKKISNFNFTSLNNFDFKEEFSK